MQNEEKKRFFQILNKDDIFRNSNLKFKIDIVNQLESGCFKKTYEEAVSNNVLINWTSDGFLVIYNKYCYIVKLHIDKDSQIGSNKILNEIYNYLDILTRDNLYRKVLINLQIGNTNSFPKTIGEKTTISDKITSKIQNILSANQIKEKIYFYLQPKSVIYPYYIAEMNIKDMSDNLFDTINMINNHTAEKIEEKYTTLRYCPKCKQNKAKQYEVQLRSFDEGTSLYLVCCNCNWNWVVH